MERALLLHVGAGRTPRAGNTQFLVPCRGAGPQTGRGARGFFAASVPRTQKQLAVTAWFSCPPLVRLERDTVSKSPFQILKNVHN